VLLALLAFGCATDHTVELGGIVVESKDSTAGLANATVTFVSDQGVPLDTVQTDDRGSFSAELPAGENVFARIDADGYVSSIFPGVIGIVPHQEVEGDALYGTSEAEHAALLAQWAGCPGLADDGFLVVGEMRVFGLTDDTSNAPSVNTGTATLTPEEGGTVIDGCYLTDDGTAYDAGAERTGESGQWLVATTGPGNWALDVQYEFGADEWEGETYPVWAPADGPAVSPWYPAWVQFAY
jgi:hypothetical protein